MRPTEVDLESHFRGLLLSFASSYIRELLYLILVGNFLSILLQPLLCCSMGREHGWCSLALAVCLVVGLF